MGKYLTWFMIATLWGSYVSGKVFGQEPKYAISDEHFDFMINSGFYHWLRNDYLELMDRKSEILDADDPIQAATEVLKDMNVLSSYNRDRLVIGEGMRFESVDSAAALYAIGMVQGLPRVFLNERGKNHLQESGLQVLIDSDWETSKRDYQEMQSWLDIEDYLRDKYDVLRFRSEDISVMQCYIKKRLYEEQEDKLVTFPDIIK